MASLSRQLVFLLAVAGLANAAPPQWLKRRRKGPDVATMISFDSLGKSGCLPADFSPPNLSGVIVEGNLQSTLQNIAEKMEEGGDVAFLSTLTNDTQWVEVQAALLAVCDNMAHNLTAQQNRTFRVACWRRLAEFECRKQLLEDIGERAAGETGKEIGGQLAHFVDSQCLHKGLDYGEKMGGVWTECAKEAELDLEGLKGLIGYVRAATAGVTGKPMKGKLDEMPEMDSEPSEQDVLGAGDMLSKLNSSIFCAMSAAGEVTADDAIDLTAIQSNMEAAEGPDWLKMVNMYLAKQCVDGGANTYFPFVVCHFSNGPYACASIDAHMTAKAGGKRPGRRQRPQRGRGGGGRRRNARRGRLCQRQQRG